VAQFKSFFPGTDKYTSAKNIIRKLRASGYRTRLTIERLWNRFQRHARIWVLYTILVKSSYEKKENIRSQIGHAKKYLFICKIHVGVLTGIFPKYFLLSNLDTSHVFNYHMSKKLTYLSQQQWFVLTLKNPPNSLKYKRLLFCNNNRIRICMWVGHLIT